MLFLYMLRSAPFETHDLDTDKRYGLTLIIHMAKVVISMMFNAIVVGILIDSLGPDGSFVSSFLSHDDVLIDNLGKILVNMLAVTAAGICLLVCCLVPEEPLSWMRGVGNRCNNYAVDFVGEKESRERCGCCHRIIMRYSDVSLDNLWSRSTCGCDAK